MQVGQMTSLHKFFDQSVLRLLTSGSLQMRGFYYAFYTEMKYITIQFSQTQLSVRYFQSV